MKRTTTATPLVTATDSEALRANETADNNDNTSKEETMAKDEAATTPTSPGQSTLAAIAKEHHDSKESNMGKNTAPTLSTTTERDPDSRNTDRTVATTSPTTTEPRPDNSKEANAETDVLKKLLIPQDFARRVGTRKLVMTIPMRNPKKQEFVRVRQMVKPMLFYTLVDEQQTYVVTSDIADSFPGHIVMKELVLAIHSAGDTHSLAVASTGRERQDRYLAHFSQRGRRPGSPLVGASAGQHGFGGV